MNDLRKKIEQTTQFNSVFGQIWNYTNFIARLLPISLTRELFGDEALNFATPTSGYTGARNFCFNKFQPINFQRFFTMQILAISLPRLLYYGYAMQLTAKLRAKKADEKYTKPIKERVVRIDNRAETVPYKTSMIVCNIISGILSVVIEMVFLYLLYKILDNQHNHETMPFHKKMRPPHEYHCTATEEEVKSFMDTYPVPKGDGIKFTVPRSYEKGFMFAYLSIMTVVSIIFLILDVITISIKETTRKSRTAISKVLRPT